jgi:hypothetical protein
LTLERDLCRFDTPVRKLWHANADGIHREPEYYHARGLGVPQRDEEFRAERRPAGLLGETEL